MVNVGDRVRIPYISDAHPQNGLIGTVLYTHMYRYYPNGNEKEFTKKQQCAIQYENGDIITIIDTEGKSLFRLET